MANFQKFTKLVKIPIDKYLLLWYNTIMMESTGYNRIKEWLLPKLDALQISIEDFAKSIGKSRTAVYYYLNDRNRPTEEVMAKMCQVLGVPLEEGLAQYTPRKVGRPVGSFKNTDTSGFPSA